MNVARPDENGESGPGCRWRFPSSFAAETDKGKEFLEFATALNVSAGGMLVAIRRALALPLAQIRLGDPQRARSSHGALAQGRTEPPGQNAAHYARTGLLSRRPEVFPPPADLPESPPRRRKALSIV